MAEMTMTEGTGTVIDDPHIIGFNGSKFDFMGKGDKSYALLSASNVQVNMKVKEFSPNFTYVSEVGVLIGTDKITKIHMTLPFNIFIDGKGLKGRMAAFDTGLPKRYGQGSVRIVNNHIICLTGAYKVNVSMYHRMPEGDFDHFNVGAEVMPFGVLSEGVIPHGILGQTSHSMMSTIKYPYEGVEDDYLVSDVFSYDFKFNRFGTKPTVRPRLGVCDASRTVVYA